MGTIQEVVSVMRGNLTFPAFLVPVLLLASPSALGEEEVATVPAYTVQRLAGNPIVRPGLPGLEGALAANINGPSLIRVPAWVAQPLGKYYLYFAHHGGAYIRLAYADKLEGPWRVHPGGVLRLADAPGRGHIASPDVHVDTERQEIRMYFHQPGDKDSPLKGQVSFVALSKDGLQFASRKEALGPFYFRVFRYGDSYYAFAKYGNQDGVICRSKDGLARFEEGPHFIPGVRHTAMWREHDLLHLVYTKVGEAPERLYHATVDLTGDWRHWAVRNPAVLLEPELDYEGVQLPLRPSNYGPVQGAVRQLRDPAIFEEDGRRYLLYSVAGEQGIAIAELKAPAK